MTGYELVRQAIEFERPDRLPFWQHEFPDVYDDVCDIWEMDRQEAGWFFDNPQPDDWGCGWRATEVKNMGQVVEHPLADASALDEYTPPDPHNPFYFERIGPLLDEAGDRYVVVTSHFALIERLHMLRGFSKTMEDFYLNQDFVDRVLDMILEFKVEQFAELHRRFGDAVHGVFMTDDWGTQQGTFINQELFDHFFSSRYETLFGAIHGHSWHVMLHSCGRINEFVPHLIEVGVDVLNMQQPQAYDLVDFGERFKGQVCFLTTCDIQSTLPSGSEEKVREEVHQLIAHWSVPEGGFIVFNYGDPEALAVDPAMSRVMFDEFMDLAEYWG